MGSRAWSGCDGLIRTAFAPWPNCKSDPDGDARVGDAYRGTAYRGTHNSFLGRDLLPRKPAGRPKTKDPDRT